MIRTVFAALYATLALLFLFQIRSQAFQPVPAVIMILVAGLSVWHVRRILSGKYESPLRLRRKTVEDLS